MPESQRMNCHCPAKFFDTHISLYYKGFDDFMVNCESVDTGEDDFMFATAICGLMSDAYDSEQRRMETVFHWKLIYSAVAKKNGCFHHN